MKRASLSILFKGIFCALLFFGWIEGMQGAKNIIYLWVLITFLTSLMALNKQFVEHQRTLGTSLPVWAHVAYGIGVLGFFAWHASWWLAAGQIVGLIAFLGTYDGVEKTGSAQA